MRRIVALGSAACTIAASGCFRDAPPDWPTSPPSVLCDAPTLERDDFCMPAARIERILREGDLRITHSALSATGTTAPSKLRIEVPNGAGRTLSFNAKWKPAPSDDADAFNNSPRREIAAYQLQKLFLDEPDWVVPPTVVRCLSIEQHGQHLESPTAWPDTGCELGVLAYWLENVSDEDVLKERRFLEDPLYRHHISNLNVLTILAGHADSLGQNFVVATDPDRPRAFSIDNGLAFGAMKGNPVGALSSAWSDMRVPILSAETAERLKELGGEDLDQLLVVAQLEKRDGQLVHVAPGEAFDPTEPVRKQHGVIQLGLSAEEVTEVHERLVGLLGELRHEELLEVPAPAPTEEAPPKEDEAPAPREKREGSHDPPES